MTSQSSNEAPHTDYIVKRKRPVIFWLFIALAIPVTLFVALYAAGYRYSNDTQSLTRTAAISLVTNPKRATVTLNGETQSALTPYIQTASAGTYRLTVEKEGYQSWEKHMTITPGKSIVFSDIILFYQTPIVKDATENGAGIDFSFDFGNIKTVKNPAAVLPEAQTILQQKGFTDLAALSVISGGPRTLLVDTKSNRTYLLDTLADKTYDQFIEGAVTAVSWVDKNTLLYATSTDVWLYQLEPKNMDLITRLGTPITSIAAHGSGQYFYYTTASGLYAVEYDSRDHRQTWTLLEEDSLFIETVHNNGRVLTLVDSLDQTRTVIKKRTVELYEADTFLR